MNRRRLQSAITLVLVFLFTFSGLKSKNVQSKPTRGIQITGLEISVSDITHLNFGYHHSSFESTHKEYDLEAKMGILTDGKTNYPLSVIAPVIANLQELYPGTHSLMWQRWTDDYPHAWIEMQLQDGRVIQISSDSQYVGMYPWNISVWDNKESLSPSTVFISLAPGFLNAIDSLWRGIGEDGFPRKTYDHDFWNMMQGETPPETVTFYVSEPYSGDFDGSATAAIHQSSPDIITPFLPLLETNPEIKQLLDAGYSFYDAILSLEVRTSDLRPIQYTGSLALVTRDGKDAVAGLVTLPVDQNLPVTISFTAEDAEKRVTERRMSSFLNGAAQLFAPITFILDARSEVDFPEFKCAEDSSIQPNGLPIQANWNPNAPQSMYFYPIKGDRWAVNLNYRRDEQGWDPKLVESILKAWFPPAFSDLPAEDVKSLSTNWGLAFQPGVTLAHQNLINELKSQLPQQVIIHKQDAEKNGDFSFVQLDGWVLFTENKDKPVISYCGADIPDWYGPAYPVKDVVPPAMDLPRKPFTNASSSYSDWTKITSFLPSGEMSTQWADITFSQPGLLHVLWTEEREGVYYADGWIGGSGWTAPQRLGEDAYWLTTKAWPDGEVHLFWDAGLRTGGTIHVWKPAGGVWQTAEHWPEIGFFSEVLRDANGILHIGAIESDGLDTEFMHRTWSAEHGLSEPENISRHIGDIGNAKGILRLDSQGTLHAAWSHLIDQKSAQDPITGETSDISGIYYARRLSDGKWTKPEQVGTFAAYAHALGMEVDANENPLIVWQSDEGLVSRVKNNNTWGEVIKIAEVLPPETPAEFGPGRWVQPSIELQTGVNSKGDILTSWLIPEDGLKLSFWKEGRWEKIVDIVSPEDGKKLLTEAMTLKMAIDEKDRIHFVYFIWTNLYYSEYYEGTVKGSFLPSYYTGYGLPEADLEIDSVGSVAVLGLPRSPSLSVKLPAAGIPPTPTVVPTVTVAPSATPSATPEPPIITATLATQEENKSQSSNLLAPASIASVLIIGLIAFLLYKKKS